MQSSYEKQLVNGDSGIPPGWFVIHLNNTVGISREGDGKMAWELVRRRFRVDKCDSYGMGMIE